MRKFKVKDPNAREESEKYDRPIPSRDAILSVLKAANNPLKMEHLMPALGLQKEDREPLRRRLKAMVRDAQVIRNRRGGYGVTERMDLVKGTIIGHPDGFGFHNPDAGGEDIYLPPRQMRQVLHGDRALVAISGLDRRGRAEGVIVEVLERAHDTLVGRYFSEGGIGFVTPDDKRIHQDVLIPAGQQGNAADGQFVEVAIRSATQ